MTPCLLRVVRRLAAPVAFFPIGSSRALTALAILAGVAATVPLSAQSASLLFEDDFESYTAGTYNNQLSEAQGGRWWRIQNSATSSGCNTVTPDQHKIVTAQSFAGSKSLRTYYNTMEQWYEAGTGFCKWRAEAAERMGPNGLPTSGSVEVWIGYAIKPMLTNGNPWVKRCMGTSGQDASCSGLRNDLKTHVSQFLMDETGSKLIAVDIRHGDQAFTSPRYFDVSLIGQVTNVLWNEWNTVVLHIKTGSAGFVECWINGVYRRYDGAVPTASWTHDFKVGIYGDRVNDYAEAYFDNVRFASGSTGGYDLVNPAAGSLPAAPANLAASSSSSSSAALTWTDNATNETSYKVERKTGASGTWAEIAANLTANSTSYTDNTVVASTTYYYRVRAANGSGNSGYSNEANVTTPGGGSTILVAETFDAMTTGAAPAGWTVSAPTGTTATVVASPSVAGKSLQLTDSTTSGFASASKSFSAQSGVTTVELSLRQNQASNWNRFFVQSGGTVAVELYTTNAPVGGGSTTYGLYYRNSAGNDVFVAALSTAAWHDIRVVANPATDRADIYVDGALPAAGTQVAFRTAVAALDTFLVATGGSTTQTGLQIDDVTISVPPMPRISDDFTTANSNYTNVLGGTWTVTGGKLQLTAPASPTGSAPNGNVRVHNTGISGDFELTIDAAVASNAGSAWDDFSIIFGYASATNYYFVSCNESNDGATNGIFYYNGTTTTQLADFTATLTPGTTYSIRIRATGTTIEAARATGGGAYTVLGTATNVTLLAAAKVGVGSRNDGVTFDSFVVQ